jgi:catechol 2,3-dioxygenase-like lactoylglutathione lyase family enzyme
VAEDLGLGHCVRSPRDIPETQTFYVDVLRFKVSDHMIDAPFRATFLHRDPHRVRRRRLPDRRRDLGGLADARS